MFAQTSTSLIESSPRWSRMFREAGQVFHGNEDCPRLSNASSHAFMSICISDSDAHMCQASCHGNMNSNESSPRSSHLTSTQLVSQLQMHCKVI